MAMSLDSTDQSADSYAEPIVESQMDTTDLNQCPLYPLGCPAASFPSPDHLRTHMSQSGPDHLRLLASELTRQRSAINNVAVPESPGGGQQQGGFPKGVDTLIRNFPALYLNLRHQMNSLQLFLARQQDQLERAEDTNRDLVSKMKNLEELVNKMKLGKLTSDDRYDPETADSQTLTERMDDLERQMSEVRRDQERCKHVERFVTHLHERIKSLEFGRSGVFLWRCSGFRTVFENAKSQFEETKRGDKASGSFSPTDFCSPLFYTSAQGYCMYMRLYPYGADAAIGKYMSLFVALTPGDYDGILAWPFRHMLEIRLISQSGTGGDQWVQTIVPGGSNMKCFQRPTGKGGNMSVGILHFIVHSKLMANDTYLKNDQIYIEMRIKDVDTPIPTPSTTSSSSR